MDSLKVINVDQPNNGFTDNLKYWWIKLIVFKVDQPNDSLEWQSTKQSIDWYSSDQPNDRFANNKYQTNVW